jgi:ankyrin repeat protein
VACCRLLLDRGAQVNAADSVGHTALWLGAFNNQLEVVDLLLERGAEVNSPADTNSTPLMAACQVKKDTERQLTLVKLLLDKGADAKATRWNDRTALHAAAEGESVPVAQLLVEHGADVNGKTDQDRTPLHIAAFFEQKSMLEYLLSAGAVPQASPQAPEATGKLYRFLAEHPASNTNSASENWHTAAEYFDKAAASYTAVAKEAGKQVTKTFWMNLASAAIAGAATGLTGVPLYYPTASSTPYGLQKKDFKKKAANCTRWAKECREKEMGK